VRAVFERVLGRAPGDDSDFFRMGGTQMAAAKALDLVEDAFDVRIGLRSFVESPTVAGLTAIVEQCRRRPGTGPRIDAPVAFSQEGMLWQEQFVPGSQNLPPLVRRFRGPLAADVLEAALNEIVRRHEPLRTRFELRHGRPVQIVAPHRRLAVPVHDLAGLSWPDQQAALATALAHAARPFDLAVGPMFEPALFRFAADDHVVVFRVHHTVYDDWSVSVFRRELSTLYGALQAGDASPLADLAVGFADFSRGQRRRLAGPAGTAQLAWWKDRLAGAPFCLQLPIDDPARVEGTTQASARPVSVRLAPPLRDGVRALARGQRATPFMAMLAAFQVLVQRYTGQSDLLMASVVANRNRPELEPMIGCFTKKILIRQDMGGDPTFVEVLSRTRESVLATLPNQDLAFETVLQETVGPAAAEHGLAPCVGVMFQGVTPQVDEVVLPGVTTTGYDTSATTTRAHFSAGSPGDGAADGNDDREPAAPWGQGLYLGTFLILSLAETAEATSLTARGAFDRPAVERLLANFVSLLQEIVADPTRRVSGLAMLADDQRRQLAAWTTTGDGPPIDRSAHEVFQTQATLTPSRVAVRSRSGEITFAELDVLADGLAARLAGAGVGRQSLVGICLRSCEQFLVAVLAIWKAGAGYVALDPDDATDRLAFVVHDAALTVVVVASPYRHLERLPEHVRLLDLDLDPDLDADPEGPTPAAPGPAAAKGLPGDVAMVFYGSGPSRVDGGVVIEHRSVANLPTGLRGSVWPPTDGVCVALSARPTDDAFVRQFVALLGGHTLSVVGPDPAPSALVSLLAGAEVDLIDVGPEVFVALVAAGLQEALLVRDASAAVPTIVVGSRRAIDQRSWWALGRMQGARTRVLYGAPEVGFAATVDQDPGSGGRVTIGRPMAGATAQVLGPAGKPVPVQVMGVLHVGGSGLARGYGVHDTGQRARVLPDGRIELVGTVADSADIGGFRIDRARLEAVLRRCAGVVDVRVEVGHDGSGFPRLIAHVVAEGDVVIGPDDLRVFLWSEFAGYAWPAEVVMVAEGRSSGRATERGVDEETLLASLWAEEMGVDRIGREQNYWQAFSFLDTLDRAAAAGVHIGGEQVTRNRTIATLAADIAARRLTGAQD